MTASQTPPTPQALSSFQISASRGFANWLQTQNCSLAFSTYKIGKVFWVGLDQGKLSITQRDFARCMGLAFDPQNDYMAIASLWQIWLMRDLLQGEKHQNHDKLYGPRLSYATGDLDVHDVALVNSEIIFANTLFSCLSKVSSDRSFEVLWKPSFISKLAAEDRCHLNGLAIRDGQPAYVTCLSATDIHAGWRDHKQDGGVVVDVQSNEIVCQGLSMPHSPRWYQDRLWVHNSGHGEFGYVDLETGRFESVCFCPGYLRGMSFVGDYAFVGLSKSRHEAAFKGLPISEKLLAQKIEDRCGIYVIDLKRGDIVQQLELKGNGTEMYDVVALPGVQNPSAIGITGSEAHYMLRFDEEKS